MRREVVARTPVTQRAVDDSRPVVSPEQDRMPGNPLVGRPHQPPTPLAIRGTQDAGEHIGTDVREVDEGDEGSVGTPLKGFEADPQRRSHARRPVGTGDNLDGSPRPATGGTSSQQHLGDLLTGGPDHDDDARDPGGEDPAYGLLDPRPPGRTVDDERLGSPHPSTRPGREDEPRDRHDVVTRFAHPASSASMIRGRSRLPGITSSTDPTSTAR